MKKVYPIDISHEQFEPIRTLFENACKKTRPRTIDLYEVFCAILCFWRTAANGTCCRTIFRNGVRLIIIFFAVERETRKRNQSAGAGVKKIRLAWSVPDRDAAPTSFCIVVVHRASKTPTARAAKVMLLAKRCQALSGTFWLICKDCRHAIAIITANVTDR